MNDFDKKLDFDSDTFENMKHDMNFVLQRLLGNMIEKQSNEGSMTIKIDVTMVKEFIPNYDPNIKGESREISKPQFKHKVTSAVKITDEKGGNLNNEMEMVMDEETGCYVLQPIANTQQRTAKSREIHQPRDLTRKSRRILPTTSWEIQTQKVMITKIRRNRHGTD